MPARLSPWLGNRNQRNRAEGVALPILAAGSSPGPAASSSGAEPPLDRLTTPPILYATQNSSCCCHPRRQYRSAAVLGAPLAHQVHYCCMLSILCSQQNATFLLPSTPDDAPCKLPSFGVDGNNNREFCMEHKGLTSSWLSAETARGAGTAVAPSGVVRRVEQQNVDFCSEH